MTVTKWTTLVRQCLLHRLTADEFYEVVHQHESDVDGKVLFNVLLECRKSFCAPGDPLISMYLDAVVLAGLVKISHALVVLIRRWNRTRGSQNENEPEAPGAEIHTLHDLTMAVVSPKYKAEASETRLCLLLSSKWLTVVARYLSHHSGQEAAPSATTVEALGFLLASLAATDIGIEALTPAADPKDSGDATEAGELRASVRQAIELCLPLFGAISGQLIERLNTLLKHIALFEDTLAQAASTSAQSTELQALQFQVSVAETQAIASKAATLVYLETLLCTASTIDDAVVFNYLSARHNNDHASMFLDLFYTSFQVLKNRQSGVKAALHRQQCQIFIQNKLPIILAMISASSFSSFSSEQAVTDAWHQVTGVEVSDPHFLTTGFRFLHICTLHHLISAQAASQLMMGHEEFSVSPVKGLYSKDDLVAQVNMHHSRGMKLVEDLVRADGSAGPLSQAIVEIMHIYCQNKETQDLKDLANSILRKPAVINSISMFVRPAYWLSPLCSLLDEWRWDEIHAESQPVYDEFGSVFLLILVCRNRLALSRSDLGVRKKDGFLARYLDQEGNENNLDDLSEDSRKYLGDWINALYIAEALGDELTTSCSAHDFYLLVPTLLRQSMTAYQRGKLSQEPLKAGLEYLLEPFLLPSLVPALSWIANILQQDPSTAATVLQVLVKSPSSADTQEIHHTILAMSAPHLRTQLQSVNSQSNQLSSLLETLNKCEDFSFSLDENFSPPSAGLVSALQQALISQLTSATNIGMEGHPASQYSPSFIRYAIKARGPESVLRSLIGVLLQFTGSHEFLLALDMVSTIVCMAGHQLSDALRLQYSRLGVLLKRNETLYAEAVVHLHRQVESYTNVLTAPAQDLGLDQFAFAQQLSNIDTANANLEAGVSGQGNLDMQPDQEPADEIDQVLGQAAAMGSLDQSDGGMGLDDLYGLHTDNMGLEGLDDLDLDMF